MKQIAAVLVVGWLSNVISTGEAATIVEEGRSRAAIFVPARIMDDATVNAEPLIVWQTLKPEDNRRRLRESVNEKKEAADSFSEFFPTGLIRRHGRPPARQAESDQPVLYSRVAQ